MDWQTFSGVVNIIIINLILSGDNAVVIAMACMGLPGQYRRKAILWGASLAVGLRIILTFIAAILLGIPFVQLLGGLLLAGIAIRLLLPEKKHSPVGGMEAGNDMRRAILTILWADLLMSLDNVLAVAGASRGDLALLVFGLALGIPIVLAGSSLLTTLMQRYPFLVYIGAGVLGWTAGEMVAADRFASPYLHNVTFGETLVPVMVTALVLSVGRWLRHTKFGYPGSPGG